MSLDVRRQLWLLSLVLVVIVDVGAGFFLESQLRGSVEQRFIDELRRDARSMQEILRGRALDATSPRQARAQLDPLTDRYGSVLALRVSIIGPDGHLVADSDVALTDLASTQNHRDRAEVLTARAGRVGVAQRHSATVDDDMLYVAELIDDGSQRVVRVSMPLSEIAGAIRQLRWTIVVAALIALGAAAILVMFATELLSRNLQRFVRAAQSGATPHDEIGDFDDDEPLSVNALADDLRRTVRLRSNEHARFETVLETMGQAVLALDAERRVNIVNQSARRLLELPEGVEGHSIIKFMRTPALEHLVEQAEQIGSARAEFTYGQSPRRRIEADAMRSRQGAGTVIVMHDVTELRRLETVRKDFIANVSHELRTPVAVIQSNAETLMAGAIQNPEQAIVFLDAVVRHAQRMGRLVADLLDISRIEAGRYILEQTPIEGAELIAQTIAALETIAANKGTKLEARIDGEVWIMADEKALEQVLFNLVSNAIKYTQVGGHVQIEVRTVPNELGLPPPVRIEVRDDGPGIDPQHYHRVFERFFRIDAQRKQEMEGTGLGLAIVKHLVEAMGGQVGLDPRLPRGSVFWFTLPTAAAVDDELDGASEVFADSQP